MKNIFKKLISLLVVICFMLSVANIPAYSAIENIVTEQNKEEYNLQKDYEKPVATTAKKARNKQPSTLIGIKACHRSGDRPCILF